MPSGVTRVNPCKVRTGMGSSTARAHRGEEISREIPGMEDILDYCDNQGLRRGIGRINNRNENNFRINSGSNLACNSISSYTRGNKKAATYDGLGSWQDYFVHFEMVAEINR